MPNWLRSIFHWKLTNWIIAIAWGTAVTAALSDKFLLAYVSLCVAAIYSIGCWVTSDTFLGKFVPKSLIYLPDGKSRARRKNWIALSPALLIVGFFLGSLYWVHDIRSQRELESLEGWLYPSNDDVQTRCPIGPKDLVLLVGSNAVVTSQFPHTVIEYQCQKVLQVDRDSSGRIGISLSILDKDGKLVADVDSGHFQVNRNGVFKLVRPDASTLKVIDNYNQEALYLHLATPTKLQLRARFYYLGNLFVIDNFHPRGSGITNSCFVGSGVDIHFGGPCLVR